jgi:glutamate/tyrosine decarboxylase-like PLP-dependent enzyme
MPVARAASAMVAAWDQNAALEAMSPTAAKLDGLAVGWVRDLLKLPDSATGVFCGGASEANLICLIVARDAVLADVGWDAQANGLFGAPEVDVVVSTEAHVSLVKALGLAGLGRSRVTAIETDDQGRVDIAKLQACQLAGGPTIVCLQAGNVNTGHSDNFAAAIEWAKSIGAWVHVDGAFGLWAAASPTRSGLVADHHRADSWATDCHKWLNVCYDSALAYVGDGARLRSSMSAVAEYLGADAGRAPMHLGLQMSQRARAVETWAALKHLGRHGVAELVDRSCDLAGRFESQLRAGGAEVLHEVVLNQLLVSFGDDDTTDSVIGVTQEDRTCWVGPTTWKSRRAMRISVSGAETTQEDVDLSVAAILACWEAVLKGRQS